MKRLLSAGLLLLLASCGGRGAAPSTAPASAPGPSIASKPAATSASAAASPGATAKPSPAASAEASKGPIKIGLLLPLTGAFGSNVGNDNKDGFELYFQTINNAVAGRPIQVLAQDDQGQGEATLIKGRELVENEKVSLLTGLEGTPEVLSLAPYVKQAKVPLAITGNAGTANLLVNPRVASPYLQRFTIALPQATDTLADWAYKQGHRKVVLLASDYAGGLQAADAAAAAFVRHGGSIIQELYPAQGTKDFGPFLAKFDQSVDAVLSFLPGADGLRMMQQFDDYVPNRKAVILDINNVIARGPNVDQLKDKAAGIIASADWTEALDSPMNKNFLKLFAQKFPGRLPSADVSEGYAGAQAVASAIEKVNGKVEDSEAFLQALHGVDTDTIKGHIKLDQDHDIVESVYIFQITKTGSQFGRKVLDTYKDIGAFWDTGRDAGAKFPYGTLKGKWTAMTKQQLESLSGSG